MTSKTYISGLQLQLDEERLARIKLEQELNQLKNISLEIRDQMKKQTPLKWKIKRKFKFEMLFGR